MEAICSRQVVETEILSQLDLTAEQKEILLESIELHDYRDMRPTKFNEALLLRGADMLEFLGLIRMAREFARGPKNVDACYRRILARRKVIQDRLTLSPARAIALIRLKRMETSLKWLNDESFGILCTGKPEEYPDCPFPKPAMWMYTDTNTNVCAYTRHSCSAS